MDEEQTQEEIAKINKFKGKVDDLMAEFGDEILSPEIKEKLEEKIKFLLKESGVPFSLTALKAFYEGFAFSVSIGRADADGQLIVPIIGYLKSTIALREQELSKQADNAMKHV